MDHISGFLFLRYPLIALLLGLSVMPGFAAPLPAQSASPRPGFVDPLDAPAEMLRGALLPDTQPILAMTQAGDRLIAVGLRGLILVSDDGGIRWQQAKVPVQSDLCSVYFVSAQRGWVVGHEGVVLHTADGGSTWSKQLDGRSWAALGAGYTQRIAAGETTLQRLLDQVNLNAQGGATLPFLSVSFDDEQTGYAIGSFGTIAMTQDGGKTWTAWLDHIDNDEFLNLNQFRRVGAELYIVGERGTVYRLDRKAQRFVGLPTSYKGSFFGLVGDESFLLAFGLAGTAYRSEDGGRSWTPTVTGANQSLTSGAMSSDGQFLVLVSEDGSLLTSSDRGRSFKSVAAERPMLLTDIVAISAGRFALSGYQGVARQKISPAVTTPAARH